MTEEQIDYLRRLHTIMQLVLSSLSNEPLSRPFWLDKLEQLSVAAIKAGVQ